MNHLLSPSVSHSFLFFWESISPSKLVTNLRLKWNGIANQTDIDTKTSNYLGKCPTTHKCRKNWEKQGEIEFQKVILAKAPQKSNIPVERERKITGHEPCCREYFREKNYQHPMSLAKSLYLLGPVSSSINPEGWTTLFLISLLCVRI